MPRQIQIITTPWEAGSPESLKKAAARGCGLPESQIGAVRVIRKSVDARGSRPKINMMVEVFGQEEPVPGLQQVTYRDVHNCPQVVVVGAGPAGLFAALRLIELGLRPLVLERGKDVSSRKRDIAAINRNEPVDPDSNYAFGEGGAGTFSDGKLYTRSKKRGDYQKSLNILVQHGADQEILYQAHPHIGSDKLPSVIRNIRQTIQDCGGEVAFGTKLTGLVVKNHRITGVECGDIIIPAQAVILATGHSARDVYRMLHSAGIEVQAKPFAMGVRVEHPQELIDSIQYNSTRRDPNLPAASYSLVTQVQGRGVYSFCMCPGGFIVPAMTGQDECVVNGMSPSGRSSRFANSGIVTQVGLEDFNFLEKKHGPLAGMEFQAAFEIQARLHGGRSQRAPAQRLTDFVDGKTTSAFPGCSYVPGVTSSLMKEWMPEFIYTSLREGMRHFAKKMRGFITRDAVVVGVESRTSTPVRIPRDPDSLCHIRIGGLFPCGEGAGYAGGIISSAMDGEKCADGAKRWLGTAEGI